VATPGKLISSETPLAGHRVIGNCHQPLILKRGVGLFYSSGISLVMYRGQASDCGRLTDNRVNGRSNLTTAWNQPSNIEGFSASQVTASRDGRMHYSANRRRNDTQVVVAISE